MASHPVIVEAAALLQPSWPWLGLPTCRRAALPSVQCPQNQNTSARLFPPVMGGEDDGFQHPCHQCRHLVTPPGSTTPRNMSNASLLTTNHIAFQTNSGCTCGTATNYYYYNATRGQPSSSSSRRDSHLLDGGGGGGDQACSLCLPPPP